VVGIGPGAACHRTLRAVEAIGSCTDVVGYRPYLDSISDLLDGRETVSTGMRQEVDRAREAVRRARAGRRVALVSSGDAGIYGMAGLALEIASEQGAAGEIDIEIVPGVTAACAAAAALGSPLSLDFATLSLSDLLVPWERIERRLEAVGAADLVVALYNPRSRNRPDHLERALSVLARHRAPTTRCGIVREAGSDDEHAVQCTLGGFPCDLVDMKSLVVVGNSESVLLDGRMVNPRGYRR
jgi:precorrin-3B C17-methyltransferase